MPKSHAQDACPSRMPKSHAQVTCPSHMPLSGVQNPVVFTCWFAAVCHALSPMASISADLRLFCARMSAAEIGLQAIYYMLAFLLGLLGPAIFFMGHDPLHLFIAPFHFRGQLSLMLSAGGIAYGCVLLPDVFSLVMISGGSMSRAKLLWQPCTVKHSN